MIDHNDYTLAWQVYLGVAVVALLLWLLLLRAYRMTGLKLWAVLAVAALLLLPSHHPEVADLWMPATIGALLSLMTGGIESAMASLIIIAAGQIVALLLAIVWTLLVAKKAVESPATPVSAASAERVEPHL